MTSSVHCSNAGATMDEVRPLTTPNVFGENATDSSVWPSLLAGQLLEAAGEYDDALAAYEATTSRGEHLLGYAPTGTAHVGAARCLIALGRLDNARAPREKAAQLLVLWRGWRVDDLHAVERRLGIGVPASPDRPR